MLVEEKEKRLMLQKPKISSLICKINLILPGLFK